VEPVQVVTRVGVFEGYSDGRVVYFDGVVFLSDDEAILQRNYLLVNEGVKLTRPGRWDDDWRAGAWYVDVVECFVRDEEVTVFDRYIDFIVPPRTSPYRVLDLEELADAMSDGHISIGAAAKALRAAQAFVDTYLHRVGEHQGPSWKDFPPASIGPYIEANRRVPSASVASPPPPKDDWRSVDIT
jgi:hypothetical protein